MRENTYLAKPKVLKEIENKIAVLRFPQTDGENVSEALMVDFVSAHATHRYVQELEQRVEALERLISALEQRSIAVAAPKPMTPARKEYMRNFMAAKRQREREQASS